VQVDGGGHLVAIPHPATTSKPPPRSEDASNRAPFHRLVIDDHDTDHDETT
jgi:hypothetical protein